MNKAIAALTALHTVADWLGAGGQPVSRELCRARSRTCLSCPRHDGRGDWWAILARRIARIVMVEREYYTQMKLYVPEHTHLRLCGVCLCYMPTKTNVPLRHILDHTSDEVWAELPETCWIKTEAAAAGAAPPRDE